MWVTLAAGVLVGSTVGRTPFESATLTGATIGTAALIRRLTWAGVTRTAVGVASGAHRFLCLTGYQLGGAVIGGAIVGTGVSYALFGKEGAMDAIDFYSNPLDVKKGKTILAAPANLAAIMKANIAVENNAAGLPAGTRVGDAYLAGGRGNPAHSDYQESGAVTAYRQMYGV